MADAKAEQRRKEERLKAGGHGQGEAGCPASYRLPGRRTHGWRSTCEGRGSQSARSSRGSSSPEQAPILEAGLSSAAVAAVSDCEQIAHRGSLAQGFVLVPCGVVLSCCSCCGYRDRPGDWGLGQGLVVCVMYCHQRRKAPGNAGI